MPHKNRADYNQRRRAWRRERRLEQRPPARLPALRSVTVQLRPAQILVLDQMSGPRGRSGLVRELIDEAILARRSQ